MKKDALLNGSPHFDSNRSVPNISIKPAAIEKILRDRDIFVGLRGCDVIPRLIYFYRSYSTLHDGQVIEHGPGLVLDFVESREVNEDQRYLKFVLGDHCTIALCDKFRDGSHSIDWVDRKFTLTSTE